MNGRTLNVRPILLRIKSDVFLRLLGCILHIGWLDVVLYNSFALSTLLHFKLRDIEPVHVVHMGVKPPCQLYARVEGLSAVFGKTFPAKVEASVHQFHVRALSQCIINNGLIFVNGDGTRRINQISSRFRVRGDTVNGAEDKLLLEVRKEVEIAFRLYKCISTSKKAPPNGGNITLLTFTLESLLMTPVPLHGASRRTLSNPPITLGNSRPSYEQTTTFLHPRRCTFAVRLFVRALFVSLAKIMPVFRSNAAICVVLPPGADAMSSTRSLGWGDSAMTGRNDDAA
jgi:hypothetical protein